MSTSEPPILPDRLGPSHQARHQTQSDSAIHSDNVTHTSANMQDDEGSGLLSNRWVILGMLFGVTAALGLPFLWYSPSFSRREKLYWSLVVIVYTIAILAITGLVLWWSLSRINAAFAFSKQTFCCHKCHAKGNALDSLVALSGCPLHDASWNWIDLQQLEPPLL